MKVTCVKDYTAPHYPDKLAVMVDRELLYRLPERWKRCAAAGAALTATLGLLAGCVNGQAPTPTPVQIVTPTIPLNGTSIVYITPEDEATPAYQQSNSSQVRDFIQWLKAENII